MDRSAPLPIFIVGAGPTGLVLALWLTRLGTPIRIIDKAAEPGLASRAMVIQNRTLEFYRQLGIADEVIRHGVKIERVSIRQAGLLKGFLPTAEVGKGQSAFPASLSIPQDVHEVVLTAELEKAGVRVQRSTELLAYEQLSDGVSVTLRTEKGDENFKASYIAGCDGAKSMVRKLAGIRMEGGVYAQHFFVADIDAKGDAATDGLNLCVSSQGFCAVLPLAGTKDGVRLVGYIPQHLGDDVGFKDIEPAMKSNTALEITRVGWFSTYRVHARVAERFKDNRVFLLGDSAHLHSPIGGQGMNTGLGDASNLAWKLATVMNGAAKPELLDTYELERIPFAKMLVNTNDQMLTLLVDAGFRGYFVRNWFLPYIVPFLWSFTFIQKLMFTKASQFAIAYRASRLSEGKTGKVHGGDRLPYVQLDDGSDNHEPLNELSWQIHVYGGLSDAVRKGLEARNMSVHEFPWSARSASAGLVRDALYLVRPDGHIGTVCDKDDVPALHTYLARWSIS